MNGLELEKAAGGRLGIWSAPTERQRRRRYGFLVSDLEEARPVRPGSWPGSRPGGTRADRDRCSDGSAKAGSPLRSAPALQNGAIHVGQGMVHAERLAQRCASGEQLSTRELA